MPGLWEIDGDRLRFNFHPGQMRAWDSTKRFVSVVAGAQSGKTSFAPVWLWREIGKRGPGDYGFVCPTFTLMELKALPEFRRLFEATLKLGTYSGSPVRRFTFSEDGAKRTFGHVPSIPTQVFFGYADNPDSLESATYKGVVCDEAGQKAFRRESWDAILRRVAINQGRILVTTTPYTFGGWLKTELHDRWRDGDPDVEFIRFASIMNPDFPREEYERARRTMPLWKFQMFMQGKFSRPAGVIYDCFDHEAHVVGATYRPDPAYKILAGVDFGAPNFAATFLAEEPGAVVVEEEGKQVKKSRYYAFAEYRPEEAHTAAEHVAAMRRLIGRPTPGVCIGGARSEGQWRAEFAAAGWPIAGPDQPDVEVGISRVYSTVREDRLRVSKACPKLLDEFAAYSRPVDDAGNPMDGIEDKDTYHGLDSARYILSWLNRKGIPWHFEVVSAKR